MGTILLLLLVTTAGYITTHFLLERVKRRYLLASGLEYVLLGVAAGPVAGVLYGWLLGEGEPVELVSSEVVRSLAPAITLGIGSIGLLAGLRMKFRHTDNPIRWEHVRSAAIINSVTALLVTAPILLWLLWHTDSFAALEPVGSGGPWTRTVEREEGLGLLWSRGWPLLEPVLPAALLVVSTTVVSAVTPIAYTVERYQAKGWTSTLAVNVAKLSEVMAIVVIGVLFAVAHPHQEAFGFRFGFLEWFVVQVAIGTLLGLLFSLFIDRADDSSDKLLVAVIGLIVFATGVAYYLKLSPIFINFIVGVVLANTSPFRDRLLGQLEQVEKPFYIVLYFFAGVAWQVPESWWVLLLAPLYLLLRNTGKWIGGELAVRTSDAKRRGIRGVGSGLIAQGGLSVAMLLSFLQVYGSRTSLGEEIAASYGVDGTAEFVGSGAADVAPILATIVLVGILVNELLAFRSTRNLLINAGEIDPKSMLAPEDMYAHPPPRSLTDSPPEPHEEHR